MFHSNVFTTGADSHHQFDFIVEIGGQWRIRNADGLIRRHRHHGLRVAGFAEKERWLAVRVKAHFTCMCGVVAAYAIDATHWKQVIAASDGQGVDGLRLKHVVHG